MKVLTVLPFAALAASIVIPDAEIMESVAFERSPRISPPRKFFAKEKQLLDKFEKGVHETIDSTKSALDHAIDMAGGVTAEATSFGHDSASKVKSWVESAQSTVEDFRELPGLGLEKHHHHCKPNLTVYELIAKSKYTTKLAALINEYEDLVNLLNSTVANFTVFAPVDDAFEKIPEDAPKPTKEELKDLLTYHVSGEFYPAGRVLVTRTIPTLLEGEGLGGEKQRLSTNLGLGGLTVNFYSNIIAIDIFGTNGVIHGIASILVPPPKTAAIIEILPGYFSTLELGLHKTGLFEGLNDTSTHVGGTVFAPTNLAFELLGPRINAFLFSPYGLKYLKALLQYHIVPNKTLYSDAFYDADKKGGAQAEGIPKGLFHVSIDSPRSSGRH